MDFLNQLKELFTASGSEKALSENTGISTDSIGKVISYALPKLVDAMKNNASSSEGAKSLFDALGAHVTDQSVEEQLQSADTDDGDKIIGHIFGDNKENEICSIAEETDLSSGQISNLLSNVAPSILSQLSSSLSDSDGGNDGSGLLGLLSAFKD